MARPPSDFNNDPMEERRAVYNEKAWAAIVVINSNATALLQAAVTQGNISYDPLGAAQIIYIEGHDETTVANYILPYLFELQISIASQVSETWTQRVLTNTTPLPGPSSPLPRHRNLNL
ncbi:putative mnng and nitrosoguanidine resistance protein [Phaeomoniella chlamydospora]|uniref:Putative mnng and nitrosoguanidine resistance protein n=1 Tax=Phaeomoniella chlamydospora TaxID=158046 RepID=A0A0G2F0P1_PHACM|nr:putative mnng and nitrosoguanidine resistance protein [Phaeomoniella chlamydospora]